MWFLLAVHLACVVLCVAVGATSARRALLLASVPPGITAIWATVQLAGGAPGTVVEATWVQGLSLSLRFQLDSVALMMTVLVSGIGALVFVYATGYFGPQATGGRFAASLLAFSASMLGLVWADSVWTLFIFWELTSITSFLLVGYKNTDAKALVAARRALMITGGGGLVLLAGLLVLAKDAGTVVLSDLAMSGGDAGALAAVLILIGVATKSAQVPFHVWLPGAMAAPTPVSAYLHSATMVKAGVFLMAVTGSAFADVAAWKIMGLALGISSMLWGAIGALRHRDAKLILAWGTVSQLGLLITLLAVGSGKAVFAATSILFAHALFKAALFLVVGEIDIRTGTRDIDELGGLWRSMPIASFVAVLAGFSMAGVPPLLGFAAKEAAIEAVLGLSGWEAWVAGAGVIGGSVLTVAYTLRFLVTVFGPGPATVVRARSWAMTAPALFLALSGVAGFVAMGVVNDVVGPAATELNAKASVYQLLRWPGITTALLVSMGVVALGAVLGLLLARSTLAVPQAKGANVADSTLDNLLLLAKRVTAEIQHGSLPVYMATMAFTVSLAALPFVWALSDTHLVLWDSPAQVVLALAIVAAAAAGAVVGSRIGAALSLGAVGTGMAGLFVVHGAPDLVLTQLLVETVVVVGFVIGLGHLSRRFPPVEGTWRTVRLLVAGFGGVAVMLGLVAASANPSGQAPVERFAAEAVTEGGGNNIVNVILTDMRGLDTLGEVVVLATVALGILALARTRTEQEVAA